MSRFNFGSLEAEPNGLADMYRILSDAESDVVACTYYVPAMLQTRKYAGALLGTANTPELAEVRADTRIRRERTLIEADVPSTCYLGAAALRCQHSADLGTMLEQVAQVQAVVEAGIAAGPASRFTVGIVPTSYIKPLPDELPKGVDLIMPGDIRLVETKDGTYALGHDDFVADRIGDPGLRGIEALHRQARLLGEWANRAVFGEAALPLIEESRATLLAKM